VLQGIASVPLALPFCPLKAFMSELQGVQKFCNFAKIELVETPPNPYITQILYS
jgi:hypothetical protein